MCANAISVLISGAARTILYGITEGRNRMVRAIIDFFSMFLIGLRFSWVTEQAK